MFIKYYVGLSISDLILQVDATRRSEALNSRLIADSETIGAAKLGRPNVPSEVNTSGLGDVHNRLSTLR